MGTLIEAVAIVIGSAVAILAVLFASGLLMAAASGIY